MGEIAKINASAQRLASDLLADLDAFIEERRGFGEELSRPEALRVLAAEALVNMGLRKP